MLTDCNSSMDSHCNNVFNYFCDVYKQYLPEGIKEGMNKKNGCVEQLDYLYREAQKTNARIYLFIDEYDHFTNNILSDASRLEEYKQEIHGTGYLHTFFDTIKSGTYSSIERVFVTGVSPVTLDDPYFYLWQPYCLKIWINLRLTDGKEVFIIDTWHILASKERRTIMLARNLGTKNLTVNKREDCLSGRLGAVKK